MSVVDRYAEAAYALVVAGAAMVAPWLALVVAAVYLIGLAALHYMAARAAVQGADQASTPEAETTP